MRQRDVQLMAIWFCSTFALFLFGLMMRHAFLTTIGLMCAYQTWFFTRPRTLRVVRRLCGEELERKQGYFIN